MDENCTVENRNAQVTALENWKVSPNPTNGNLQISLPASTETRTLEMYDQWGKKMRSYQVGKEGAFFENIGDLATGIYYLKIVGSEKNYSVQKVFLQH